VKTRDLKEQYVCPKCCFELGKNATETSEMLKVAFGKQPMGRTKVFKWFPKFKSGVTFAEYAKCLGHQSISK
jgi:hypothetical protein